MSTDRNTTILKIQFCRKLINVRIEMWTTETRLLAVVMLYLEGGVEAAADGDVPPAFTRRVKWVLGRARYFTAVLWTARPVYRRIHRDCLSSLWNDVRWRNALRTRLPHATNCSLATCCILRFFSLWLTQTILANVDILLLLSLERL